MRSTVPQSSLYHHHLFVEWYFAYGLIYDFFQIFFSFSCLCRKWPRWRGAADTGVVHSGEQEERSDTQTGQPGATVRPPTHQYTHAHIRTFCTCFKLTHYWFHLQTRRAGPGEEIWASNQRTARHHGYRRSLITIKMTVHLWKKYSISTI